MKAYLTVFRIRALASFQYRLATVAKLAPPLFVGFVQVQFFRAFFAGSGADQPLTLPQTITYAWIIQLLVGIQPWSGDPEVLQIIRNGNLAYELCRPLDLYGQWFSRLVAQRLMPLLLQSVPLAAAALFLFPEGYKMGAPASVASALAFLLSVAGAVLMSSALSNMLGIFTVWTISGEGIYFLAPVIFMVLSGALVPLPLFPPGLAQVLDFLPFGALLDTPARVYLGLVSPAGAVLLVARQALWTAAFILAGRVLLGRALKSVTILGG